jgi:hypothetical protein
VALGALPPRNDGSGSRNPFGPMGWVALGLGAFIALYAALMALFGISAIRPSVLLLGKLLRPVSFLLPYAMIAFVTLLAAIAWRERNYVAQPAPLPTNSARSPGSSFPAKTLIGLSLGAALVTFQLAYRDLVWPIALLTQVTSTVLPTALMYVCLRATLWLAARTRTAMAFGLVALTLLPFGQWGYAYRSTEQDHRRQDAEIAAIPTVPSVYKPDTMVIESPHVRPTAAVWKIGLAHLIYKGGFAGKRMQSDRPMPGEPWRKPRPIETLPDSYLLLKVGRPSSFAKPRQVYATAGGPFELRLIGPQRDDLIAVWYREFNPLPVFPPLLTTMGWFRGGNSATTTEIDAAVYAFLDRALSPGRTASASSQ